MTRLPNMKVSVGYDPSESKLAAIGLINEMNHERRISTVEAKVLFAGLVDVPVVNDLSSDFQRYLRPERSNRLAKSEASS